MNQKLIIYNQTTFFKQVKMYTELFCLIFDLDKGYDSDLKKMINNCIKNEHCQGVIFHIDDITLSIGKLSFIGKMFEALYLSNKRIGVWGVPTCVPRTFLSKYDYMRFLHQEIKELMVDDTKSKIFIPECEYCVDKDQCSGFGNIDLKIFHPRMKKKSFENFLLLYKNRPFSMNLEFLNKMHEIYLNHCKKVSITTDRYIYYVTYLNMGSQYTYNNRFVYSCDFLNDSEYKNEFDFLYENVLNTKYIDHLRSITNIEKTEQIAYSLVEKEGTYRESFYVAVSKSYGKKILEDFQISEDFSKLNNLNVFAVGIDMVNMEIACYKVYYHTTKTYIATYFENINVLELKRNQHHFVVRLDQEQNVISYKIDMYISYEDLRLFKPLLKDYDYFDKNFSTLGIYMLGIEIQSNKIMKINIYHRYIKEENR